MLGLSHFTLSLADSRLYEAASPHFTHYRNFSKVSNESHKSCTWVGHFLDYSSPYESLGRDRSPERPWLPVVRKPWSQPG